MRKFKTTLIALALVLTIASCNTMVHTVGSGGSGQSSESKRQWYVLFGLVPLNTVDSKSMAGSATNYTIKTQNTLLDQIIAIFTGIATIHPATITVTK